MKCCKEVIMILFCFGTAIWAIDKRKGKRMDAEYREPEYKIVGRYGPSSCSHPVDSSDLQSKEASTQPKCLLAASPYCSRSELFRGVVSGTAPG